MTNLRKLTTCVAVGLAGGLALVLVVRTVGSLTIPIAVVANAAGVMLGFNLWSNRNSQRTGERYYFGVYFPSPKWEELDEQQMNEAWSLLERPALTPSKAWRALPGQLHAFQCSAEDGSEVTVFDIGGGFEVKWAGGPMWLFRSPNTDGRRRKGPKLFHRFGHKWIKDDQPDVFQWIGDVSQGLVYLRCSHCGERSVNKLVDEQIEQEWGIGHDDPADGAQLAGLVVLKMTRWPHRPRPKEHSLVSE